ncbi:putative choline kinase 1 [Ananas comosus]|uniref:Putative choline kinase 1 n=1 Tax=Ananas comosus TaxID=4615 RepID=A0A199VBN1_ANACO|nr:putative choline kinase 1 [Ananas comosus]
MERSREGERYSEREFGLKLLYKGHNWVLNRFLFRPLRVVPSPPSVTEFLLSSFLRRSLSSALLSPPLSSLHSLSSPCRTQQWLHPPLELRPPSTKSSEARTPSAPPAGTHCAVVRRRGRGGGGGGEGGAVGARGDSDEGGDDERGLPGAVAEEETGTAKEEEEEEEEEVRKKKVLLRIYGDGTDLFFDLADEVCTFECISRHGQGPRVLARFPNGRIEEFIHARSYFGSPIELLEMIANDRIMDEFMNGSKKPSSHFIQAESKEREEIEKIIGVGGGGGDGALYFFR